MGVLEPIAGRAYLQAYRVSGRADLRDFLVEAVGRSGGTVLYASDPGRAPVVLGIQGGEERLGLVCYGFRCNPPPIRGRAPDEHRLQVRYGGEASWDGEHPVGRDPAGVDVTLVLGVHLQADLLIGLDPLLYDPLPMGISVEFKDEQVGQVQQQGWHVWERVNQPGRRRQVRRALEGLETLVGLRPERLLDYARLERQAAGLGLDPPLRYRAAIAAASPPAAADGAQHLLEREFALTGVEILEIIASRNRLAVAVRGGVAEHHLERQLLQTPGVVAVRRLDRDGEPDFEVMLADGRGVLVECKNASPEGYANGDFKVEVQKTRASRGDPASRLYRVDQFDIVAACLFSATRQWTFRFKATAWLSRDAAYPDRVKPIQRIDGSWSTDLHAALT